MYRLLQFLKRYVALLLFIVLEAVAINYYANSTGYTRAKVYSATTRVTGGIQSFFASVGDYFTLRRDNGILVEQLAKTEAELAAYRKAGDEAGSLPEIKYEYTAAKVVSNSITRQNNYFVVNRGESDGVSRNMAVLSINGMVAGYVADCSDNYAVCISILNRDFRIGGKIKGKDYFGSVFWDGTSSQYVTLSDIPRYAPLEKGDTILSAYSARFPQDSFIGTIESFREAGDGTYYEIKVKLGMDIIKLSDVMLIRFSDSEELMELAGRHMPEGI